MDNLTHALVGAVMSRSLAGTTQRNPVWWAFLTASEIPDIDILYLLQGHTSYLINHRGWTHSLPGVALLSLGVAVLIFLVSRGRSRFKGILAAALLASLVHVGLDALTSWGTGLFHPFQKEWVYLDTLPIIDPILFAILLPGLLAARFRPFTQKAAKAALLAMILFIVARGSLHAGALQHFQASGSNGAMLAMPTSNPMEWRIVREEAGFIEQGELDLYTGAYTKTEYLATAGSAEFRSYTPDPAAIELVNFFRIPVFSGVEREGMSYILVKDLSYERDIREALLETNCRVEPGVWYKVFK